MRRNDLKCTQTDCETNFSSSNNKHVQIHAHINKSQSSVLHKLLFLRARVLPLSRPVKFYCAWGKAVWKIAGAVTFARTYMGGLKLCQKHTGSFFALKPTRASSSSLSLARSRRRFKTSGGLRTISSLPFSTKEWRKSCVLPEYVCAKSILFARGKFWQRNNWSKSLDHAILAFIVCCNH